MTVARVAVAVTASLLRDFGFRIPVTARETAKVTGSLPGLNEQLVKVLVNPGKDVAFSKY